ncbi:MAG: hypothetical protein H0U27_06570, partial [Nitrosopumilus sp.]|nr:hypothetical protein [Nitrosopumilus sp.]
TQTPKPKPNKKLKTFIQQSGLIDFEKITKNQPAFTHPVIINEHCKYKSRLDYFLINQQTINTGNIKHDTIYQSELDTDHALILLTIPNVGKWSKKQVQNDIEKSTKINFTLPNTRTKEGKKLWNQFNETLDSRIEHILDTNDIEEQIKMLHSEIINTAKEIFKFRLKKNNKVNSIHTNKDEEEKRLKKLRQTLLKVQIKLYNGTDEEKVNIIGRLNANSENQARRVIRRAINIIGNKIKSHHRKITYNIFKAKKDARRKAFLSKDMKQFHKLIKKRNKQVTIHSVIHEDTVTNEPEMVKNTFKEFWENQYKNEKQKETPDYSKSNKNNNKHESLTKEITIEEVASIINSMKNGKASGKDNITYEFYKNGSDLLIDVITAILNNCMRNNYTPKEWKEGRIWMIHKSGSQYEPGNFRPITLLNTSFKIYTKLLYKRLQHVVEKNNLLSNNQAGFRKHRSCINKIRLIKNAIEDAKMHKKPLYLMLIDFKKAFDSVNHNSIFEALDEKGIPHKFIAIIQDLYNDAYSDIITDHGCTDMFKIGKGTRQGCLLSTILFSLLIDKIPKIINQKHQGYTMARNTRLSINSTLFADDLALATNSNKELQDMAYTLEECIEGTGIEINATKTEIIKNSIACKLTKDEEETIILSGIEIEVQDDNHNVKYLGVWTNGNGTNIK